MKTYLQLIIGLILFSLSIENVFATDILSAQTNEYLVQKIDSFQYDKNNPQVWKYLNAYILKAKIRKDNETLFYGYKEGIFYSNDYSNKLKYADSTIVTAQKTQNNDFVIQSYLSKGLIHFQFKKFQPALENYLIAERKLNNKSSEYISYKVIFNLALIKFHLKQFSESDVLFQKCTSYFEKNSSDENHHAYFLNSIYYRTQVLQFQQKYKLASQLNRQGLRLSQQKENTYFIHYFWISTAIDYYFNKNYEKAIYILTKEIHYVNKQEDFYTLSKAYFYLGKSYEKLNQFEKSIEYFEKIDQLFNQYEFLDSEVRPAYKGLIDNSANKNDFQNELYYINQLLKLDSLTQRNIVKITPIIQKEYDEKELLKLKKNVEYKLLLYPVLNGVMILVSSIMAFWICKRLIKKTSIKKKISVPQPIIDIPPEVVLDITRQLDEFEANQLFLEPTLTLAQLCRSFKTNSAYLSRVINSQKGTNFSNYINQLKVNYILNLLNNSKKFHQHSLRDLAELGGFSSARHFSDAFFQVTSLRPYEYIKQLKNQLNNNN